MSDTKAANLRLENEAYSLLHYLSAIEGRAKADIVEEAIREYSVRHLDRIRSFSQSIASAAGLPISGKHPVLGTRADRVARAKGRSRKRLASPA
jgi:predicted DNA-binding protein